jgi:hypothetical protein
VGIQTVILSRIFAIRDACFRFVAFALSRAVNLRNSRSNRKLRPEKRVSRKHSGDLGIIGTLVASRKEQNGPSL